MQQTSTVFQTRPYLSAYRRFFGRGKEFHRLYVRDSQGAPGAAYLMSRGRSALRLEWWGAGIHDIGGASAGSPEAAALLWQRIEALAATHHGASLAQVEAASPWVELARASGWNITPAEPCPVLAFPDSWAGYVSSLGKNMREQIKRYPKRLEKQFTVEYELASTPEQVESAMTDLFALHGKRWRAKGQTGVLALPRRQKFHRYLCQDLLERGWLRLWSLRCDGRPACVLLSYAYEGRYYFFIGGFEPELMRWSVGTCLFAHVFQTAIEEGAHEFDFLRGEEEYKYRFGAQNREYVNLSLHQDSARGKLLRQRMHIEETFMHKIHEKFGAAKKSAEGKSDSES